MRCLSTKVLVCSELGTHIAQSFEDEDTDKRKQEAVQVGSRIDTKGKEEQRRISDQ